MSLKDLQFTRYVKVPGGMTYTRVLQNNKPLVLKTENARLHISTDYDVVYIVLLDKQFETCVMMLESWFLGECFSTIRPDPSCLFRSVIRPGTFEQKNTIRCKIDSKTRFFSAEGEPIDKHDIVPNTIVSCALEIKCGYFSKDSFGLSLVIREVHCKELIESIQHVQDVCRILFEQE